MRVKLRVIADVETPEQLDELVRRLEAVPASMWTPLRRPPRVLLSRATKALLAEKEPGEA